MKLNILEWNENKSYFLQINENFRKTIRIDEHCIISLFLSFNKSLLPFSSNLRNHVFKALLNHSFLSHQRLTMKNPPHHVSSSMYTHDILSILTMIVPTHSKYYQY